LFYEQLFNNTCWLGIIMARLNIYFSFKNRVLNDGMKIDSLILHIGFS